MTKKTIIIVVVSLLVALLVILGVVLIFRLRNPASPSSTPATNTNGEVGAMDPFEASLAACAELPDPDLCRDGQRFQAALREKSATYCGEVTRSETRNMCYELVAIQQGDSAICAGIDNAELQASCTTRAAARSAILSGDAAVCQSISGNEQIDCLERVFGGLPSISVAGCARYSDDLLLACQEYVELRSAANAKDRTRCTQQAGRFRSLCDVYVPLPSVLAPNEDADGDGLSNADEQQYKANPFLPDTDGDGYTDGAEVQNGYDPAGPGSLSR